LVNGNWFLFFRALKWERTLLLLAQRMDWVQKQRPIFIGYVVIGWVAVPVPIAINLKNSLVTTVSPLNGNIKKGRS
jgi:hypothetical protein